jgi:hypothetical protein
MGTLLYFSMDISPWYARVVSSALDLTPCDNSLWDIIKETAYSKKPCYVHQMKDLICQDFETTNSNKELFTAINYSLVNSI